MNKKYFAPTNNLSRYPLYDELNKNNHVCLHSKNCCSFCVKKIHVKEDPKKDIANTYYIAPFEVVVHNTADDIWVSFLGKVYNLTNLVEEHRNDVCIQPLIAFAGKDLSHWFDEKTGDIRHYIHPVTGAKIPFCPHGPLPAILQQVPTSSWEPERKEPWWVNERYMIGYLSKRVRPLRIQNMLSREICSINVCMEDTLHRILERYLLFNSDADSYTWLYDDRVLDMSKNLEENIIPDERDDFVHVGLPENTYVPMLLLYYNDDLKWE